MTKRRIATLALFLFMSSVAMFWGFVLEKAAKGRMADFKLAYYDAQCLLSHCDPYSERKCGEFIPPKENRFPSMPYSEGRSFKECRCRSTPPPHSSS